MHGVSLCAMTPSIKRTALVAVAVHLAQAFYLPGIAPKEYNDGEQVDLKVNKLTSVRTQLPYGYYSLPHCRPPEIKESIENLGEILTGDAIENSLYEIQMLRNDSCKMLCKVALDEPKKEKYRRMIDDEYLVNWIVDNLPAATRYVRQTDGLQFTFMSGFPVGIQKEGHYFLHNHVMLDLQFHRSPTNDEGYRIVGFEVEPYSITQATRSDANAPNGVLTMCSSGVASSSFDIDEHDEIIYTYDVRWTESEVRWASRWDIYLKISGGQIHWFSIVNSLTIVLALSGLVAMILLRTLWRDIAKYNELATEEEQKEETGWKLVHADVFRKPMHSKLLCVSAGSGAQILAMSVITLVFALLGFLSPAHRGGLLQSIMLLFTLMGTVAGYVSARFYKLFNGDDWKAVTFLTAVFYPGVTFVIFFILNLFIWGQRSSGAVPFLTMFVLLVMWFGISVPLVFVGAYVGAQKPPIELPVGTSQVARRIPEQPWYMQPWVTALVGGILPFGAVFTELFFIMSSLWQHQFYYMFGFLTLVLLILVVTCAEISIALTYFQLTSENYEWWWPSFFASGSCGVYVFLYSILYFTTRLLIDKVVSTMLYFGYMFLMSMMFFLLTGSIGFISSFWFVRAIYGSIKID